MKVLVRLILSFCVLYTKHSYYCFLSGYTVCTAHSQDKNFKKSWPCLPLQSGNIPFLSTFQNVVTFISCLILGLKAHDIYTLVSYSKHFSPYPYFISMPAEEPEVSKLFFFNLPLLINIKPGLWIQFVSKVITMKDDSWAATVHSCLWLDKNSINKLVEKADNCVFFQHFFFLVSAFENISVIELNGKPGH